MANGTVYATEQTGILAADKILIGIAAAVVPAIIALFRLQPVTDFIVKGWLFASIVLVVPTLFTLIWHSVRWPVRLQLMKEWNEKAAAGLANDLIHILTNVAEPKAREAIFGKSGDKIIKGDDGKEYVMGPMEDVKKKFLDTCLASMKSDNPIVANTLSSNASKMYEAQRRATHGCLDERFARFKQFIDLTCRYTRHVWFFLMLMSVIVGLLTFLK